MPGPTPISALIHAATMVAAGVFLVARLLPLFELAPVDDDRARRASPRSRCSAPRCMALVADDLKRVLAWSTVSQLAYMFGALALGGYAAGVLHLLSHGAFKALLFLAAGSVIHAVGTQRLDSMGGLRRAMPVTFATMTIGFAALAGRAAARRLLLQGRGARASPPTQAFARRARVPAVADPGRRRCSTAALTAAYSMRAWLMVFFGPAPTSRRRSQPHESPRLMTGPLVVLAGAHGARRAGRRLPALPRRRARAAALARCSSSAGRGRAGLRRVHRRGVVRGSAARPGGVLGRLRASCSPPSSATTRLVRGSSCRAGSPCATVAANDRDVVEPTCAAPTPARVARLAAALAARRQRAALPHGGRGRRRRGGRARRGGRSDRRPRAAGRRAARSVRSVVAVLPLADDQRRRRGRRRSRRPCALVVAVGVWSRSVDGRRSATRSSPTRPGSSRLDVHWHLGVDALARRWSCSPPC